MNPTGSSVIGPGADGWICHPTIVDTEFIKFIGPRTNRSDSRKNSLLETVHFGDIGGSKKLATFSFPYLSLWKCIDDLCIDSWRYQDYQVLRKESII